MFRKKNQIMFPFSSKADDYFKIALTILFYGTSRVLSKYTKQKKNPNQCQNLQFPGSQRPVRLLQVSKGPHMDGFFKGNICYVTNLVVLVFFL